MAKNDGKTGDKSATQAANSGETAGQQGANTGETASLAEWERGLALREYDVSERERQIGQREAALKDAGNSVKTANALPSARMVKDLTPAELHAQAVEAIERFQSAVAELHGRMPCRAATAGMPAINTAAVRILDHYAAIVQTAPEQQEKSGETAANEGAGGAAAAGGGGGHAQTGGGAAR